MSLLIDSENKSLVGVDYSEVEVRSLAGASLDELIQIAPKRNAPITEKIAYQKLVSDRAYKKANKLWEEIELKKAEIEELERQWEVLNNISNEEWGKLNRLEDKTPKGQVLRAKFILSGKLDLLKKQRGKLAELVYSNSSYEVLQRKRTELELKISKSRGLISAQIMKVKKLVKKHGNHGDTWEWLLRDHEEFHGEAGIAIR